MVAPPRDWSDTAGWNAYYEEEDPRPLVSSARYCDDVIASRGRAWFPGCGMDPGPALAAALGANVVASDLSSTAIRWQRLVATLDPDHLLRTAEPFREQLEAARRADGRGSFDALVHDFVRDEPPGDIDLIVNVRAFQGLPPDDMRAAARRFARALRPGGRLYVDTMNVQGELRATMEDAAAVAGLYIPGLETARWFRRELAALKIAYRVVLGVVRPIDRITRSQQSRLDSIVSRYRERQNAEGPELEARCADGVTKISVFVHNTG